MPEHNHILIEKVRKLLPGYNSDTFTFPNLAKELDLPLETLIHTFYNEAGLVEKILDYEQQNLEDIFSEFDFTGINAIDRLLTVSKQISDKSIHILPCITFDLRAKYPEVRQKFVEKRIEFVNSKIKLNFEHGMQQGLYRPDLSEELVSRIYISRLIDLHNPDFFPTESISFSVLFEVMFDTFIRGICTEEGTTYYEKKIRRMKF